MSPESREKRWELLGEGNSPGASQCQALRGMGIPPVIMTILANRELTDPAEISRFLNPTLEQLPLPKLLHGLDKAVEILADAHASQDPVLVHGDYDADGVTATALLVMFFREIGLPVFYHLPDRFTDGYGLNHSVLASLRELPGIAEHPAPVLLTVDCGISNLAEVAAAKALGFRVIVSDHHLPGPDLPAAEAVVNPHQPGCPFPFKELAGVGVAFYLAAGLRSELVRRGGWADAKPPNLKKYLDLVAIGTVADMVPLRGANRVMVKTGLEVLNSRVRPGLRAMLARLANPAAKVTADTISYQLAPRLNAAGRTGSAVQALKLLLAEDAAEAALLARDLDAANQLRKEFTEKMFNEASLQAEGQVREANPVLVVSSSEWQLGIAGLLASRLVKEYWRPSVVLVVDQAGVARGSVRSLGDIDILAALQECTDLLDRFGGHRQAAGVTLRADRLAEFARRLREVVGELADAGPRLEIDLVAEPAELLRPEVRDYLQRLEPYGMGNPEPLFCVPEKGIRLLDPKIVGSGSLRFRIMANGQGYGGVGFGMAGWAEVAAREALRLAYRICCNEYRGAEQWELRLEDIKETG